MKFCQLFSDAVRVPVALLVVEGGPGSLKTVVNAIKNNTPAVVIKVCGDYSCVLFGHIALATSFSLT